MVTGLVGAVSTDRCSTMLLEGVGIKAVSGPYFGWIPLNPDPIFIKINRLGIFRLGLS